MDLRSMCSDRVSIEKKNGATHHHVLAQVSTDMILIPEDRIPIERGDTIIRTLPGGIIERLSITDTGYQGANPLTRGVFGGRGHYQAKYRYENDNTQSSSHAVYNISGPNARLNINSTDNSTNEITSITLDLQKFATALEQLRLKLAPMAKDADQFIALGKIAEAEREAKENKQSNAIEALSKFGSAGRWVLDAAKEIGVSVVAEVITKNLGF